MSHARTACPRRGLMGRRERVRKEECIEARKHRDNITRDILPRSQRTGPDKDQQVGRTRSRLMDEVVAQCKHKWGTDEGLVGIISPPHNQKKTR